MGKKVQSYNLMIAHSADTTEFVDVVKTGVTKFCNEYNSYNINAISFDVKDFNDATFATYSQADTQDIVFEQFAGHADIVIALIGARIGKGLQKELESFIKEKKQTFVYLYDGGFRAYNHWDTYRTDIAKEVKNVTKVIGQMKDNGYSKIFVAKEELITHIINDLRRFFAYRQRTKFELLDKSYARFAYDEVDRYRKEISSLICNFISRDTVDTADSKTRMIKWIEEHSQTNILELMRLLRSMLAREFDLDYTTMAITFVWGYHNPKKSDNEKLIKLNAHNVISLNHSGSPAKLIELLKHPTSLLRYMIESDVSYKWYQYKSYACAKGRYWWTRYEASEKKKCINYHHNYKMLPPNSPCPKCAIIKNTSEDEQTKTANTDQQFGGSIFCYRVTLNGDGIDTNNYALGYIMVATNQKPFTNTVHDSIRDKVKETIKNMVTYRIKPQLLVELSQLYIAYLYGGCDDEVKGDDEDEYNAIWQEIENRMQSDNIEQPGIENQMQPDNIGQPEIQKHD